ncbi:uncharacterized protein E0L32_000797 [Thyridium curvatum]|uniref:BTB domain-containing protein n=1 Tax=Thyridium curvatum TaxID=1093900 RepID=A0A507B7K2_9PEZI|nr:uncharacterized protein E0L32_000797 [Thyridium curvatum]TPX12620.1 hypothetical protein E0L32_000797 [Thyridium curvatum]
MSNSPAAPAEGHSSLEGKPLDPDGSDADLFQSGFLADATVKCGDKTFNVHLLILCRRCEWFKKCFVGHYKESQDREVTIVDENPDLIECLLFYIYSQDVEKAVTKLANITQWSRYKGCVMLWKAGDFFLLPGLKRGTRKHLFTLIKADISRLCSIDDPTAFSIDEISDAIRAAYTIPNAKWWRTAIAGFLCIARRNTLKSDKLFELMEEIPHFAVDFLKSLRHPSPSGGEMHKGPMICGKCFKPVKKPQDGAMWYPLSISDVVVVQHLKCIEWSTPEAGKP